MPHAGGLAVCQGGFEALLCREMSARGAPSSASGPGWAFTEGDPLLLHEGAFPHAVLESPLRAKGESVNELAQSVASIFFDSIRGERLEGPWPCVFAGGSEAVGLGRRVASVEEAFHERLRGKLGRIAKLATTQVPRIGPARGLFVWFDDFHSAYVSRSAQMNGQRRMADDPLAPSRSYLKVEEAYAIAGAEPAEGQSVCDLGAAPGGWSYSAARRGARVVAVDNGPMKLGALGNPLISHRQSDAFGFGPAGGPTFDWLFSDILDDPHTIIRSIAGPWLSKGWCRRFIINLKFGRVDPIALLAELRSGDSPFARHADGVRIRHLYHDREEFTVTGAVR
ncbi:MAG TPA: SAM-dependent methyltransferase [Opitutaceae bacterium]|jgi:23S rRNA (cytidine2498-2'-O)-methyltransferase